MHDRGYLYLQLKGGVSAWRRRTESVKNTSVNITDNFLQGLVELYAAISVHTKELGIDFLVVGTTARDS